MRWYLPVGSLLVAAAVLLARPRVRTAMTLWMQEVLDATFERVEELRERERAREAA